MGKFFLGFLTSICLANTSFANLCGNDSNFGGYYLGGHVGGIGVTTYTNDLDGFLSANITQHSLDVMHSNHVATGVQLGYDLQCEHKVLGAVVDWSWTGVKTHHHFDEGLPLLDLSLANRLRWFSTIRLRGGLALEDVLFYLTAGAVVANTQTKYSVTLVNFSSQKTFNEHNWGWTVGAGLEWSLWCRWHLNFELLSLIFSTKGQTITNLFGPNFHFDHWQRALVGRISLNYRFCL